VFRVTLLLQACHCNRTVDCTRLTEVPCSQEPLTATPALTVTGLESRSVSAVRFCQPSRCYSNYQLNLIAAVVSYESDWAMGRIPHFDWTVKSCCSHNKAASQVSAIFTVVI